MSFEPPPPLDKIISKIEKENSVFANKGALDSLAFPSKIHGRESQMEQLVRFLLGYRTGHVVPFVSVYGRSGSGKTVIVEHVCRELKEIEYLFVNLRRTHTVFGAVNLVLSDLGLETIKGKEKFPFENISGIISSRLEQKGKKLFVLVLDEFDVIFGDMRGRPSDFIYKLTEIEKDLAEKNCHLCVIGISNNILSEYDIDDRVKSRIGSSEIFFTPYFHDRVLEILAERAEKAFAKKIESSVLERCAKIASEDHGDARRAIDLLRVAGELAGSEGVDVSVQHVERASKELQKDRIENVIAHSSPHLVRVMAAIARLTFLSEQDWHYTSSIVQQYRRVWLDKTELLLYRRVSEIVREVESMGFLVSQQSSRGRHGYGKQYKLTVSPHVIGRIINRSWWEDIIKAKEMHQDLVNEIKKRHAYSNLQRETIARDEKLQQSDRHWERYVWQQEEKGQV